MDSKIKLLKFTGFFLLLLMSIIYTVSFFLIPFSDWDTAFYPLVGKGIFQYHILPYGYIFDHKPFLVYVFYYMWCKVEVLLNGRFTILSLLSICLISTIIVKFYKTNLFLTIFYVFLGGTLGIYLSGNTEVIQIPLILSSIVLLTIGIENKNNYLLSISGVFASIVVNINYLSVFILAPIFLYVLCSKLCSIGRFFVILSSVLLSIGIIFIPFLIAGRGKILEYFYMQNHFLHLYSASPKERLHTIQMVIVEISFLYPALIIWFSNKNIFWNNIRERMLTLWFLSSVLAAIMSGHSYDHYASLFLIPAMAICAILHRNGQMSSFWLMSPLYVYSFISMIHSTTRNINEFFVVNSTNYHEISQIVGKSKVLNIRSDHSLYYLANLETFDRFLFTDHIDIYFGNQADEHYMQDLRQKPKFVLMSYKSCDVFNNDNNICKWINDKYHLIYKVYNYKKPLRIEPEYYELYKLNE